MVSIHLIAVGKLKERFFQEAAAEYQKRLGAYCRLTLTELPEERLPQSPSPAQVSAALAREAAAIRSKLPSGGVAAALCVEGSLLSSPQLARRMEDWSVGGARHISFLIGGSYGLDETLKGEADLRLSMSPMTFPHHLARVMLLEQLYRAFKISEGSAYHK